MILHNFFILTIFLCCYSWAVDPCSELKCKKPLTACPETRDGQESCQCAIKCSQTEPKSKLVTTKFGNLTLKFDSRVVPLAKQGGASCYQSACMNGGTCYTNYNVYNTQPITTTTTTSAPSIRPLCSCQAQFSGSRCELYNPSNNVPQEGWNNLCRVYNDKNMNICQNGGQCVYISDNKVACVCPSTFVGQYCEIPVYEECSGPANAQCHREYGKCLPNGDCQCNPNHTGTKCDIPISSTAQVNPVTTTRATQSPVQSCLTYFCQNGGTCRPTNYDPYVICLCPPSFTGSRCEIYVSPPTPQPQTAPPSPCQTQQYCYNGGTCQPSSYKPFAYCLCPIGYTGTRCEICLTVTTPAPSPVSPCSNQQYCYNGGTCQPSSYEPFAYCLCPIGYTGSRCEICLTTIATQPATLPPSPCQTQQYCYNGGTCQPSSYKPFAYCLCPIGYTGTRCEICLTVTTPAPSPVSPCSNQQYCLNGGTCRATNYSPYAICICPPNYTGTKCEICIAAPVTVPATTKSTCQTQVFCLNGGTCRPTNYSPYAMCICPPNYTGSRCEICVSSPVTSSPGCLANYCLNGGTCESISMDPYVSCRCPPNFTGTRCEICVGSGPGTSGLSSGTPRCNFTVSVRNDGAYVARFKLMYSIDGITQPLEVSNSIAARQTQSITIPYFAKDLVVISEKLFFDWYTIFTDTGINMQTKCTKCYKVWGAVTNPQWDYLLC
ncbi:neurogenic locus notch -like protein [Brachionus plicatilis]|uniref:Neurogenic locus notch-like protein n=1 Tax=Brachionus plicatilis TaxID=10195 RepID=A0A3M7PBF9_BRAPC|nr:neurogenic locus notch -like protein [Brachionus plicatilis]